MGVQASYGSSRSYHFAARNGGFIFADSAFHSLMDSTLRNEQQPERNQDSNKQPPDGEDPEKDEPAKTGPLKQEYGHCPVCKGSGKTAAQCIYPRTGPPCGHCNRRRFDAERCQGGLDQGNSSGGGSGAAVTIDNSLANLGHWRSRKTDGTMNVIKVTKGKK